MCRYHATRNICNRFYAYYILNSRFLRNLSLIFAPLDQLLIEYVPWVWSHDQDGAFIKVKTMILSKVALVHYDPAKLKIISCDASFYGL